VASFGPLDSLALATELNFLSADRVGEDLRIRARVVGRDQF
jgi:diaminohydroxyphosphoribosylaminopyrimidine deaminase/5-amino-6-(5-phosphoribosylamino)uracil reductase